MILVISPAKTLDFESPLITEEFELPEQTDKSEQLIKKLRRISKKELGKLMSISDDLAALNHQRYIDWTPEFDRSSARIALQAFKGDVYVGMDAGSFTPEDLDFASHHLRILSGLHGLLRPLDLIKPYRLEMGTRLPVARKKNLYEFWSKDVTQRIQSDLEQEETPVLVNLASDEYFKVIDTKKLTVPVIKPVFKDLKNGNYKVISFLAKKARGYMAAYIIKHRIQKVEDLKNFTTEGYAFQNDLSTSTEWVFTRDSSK